MVPTTGNGWQWQSRQRRGDGAGVAMGRHGFADARGRSDDGVVKGRRWFWWGEGRCDQLERERVRELRDRERES